MIREYKLFMRFWEYYRRTLPLSNWRVATTHPEPSQWFSAFTEAIKCGTIGRMKARNAALLLTAILFCVPGRAQSKPSIAIGGHVLTLGMQESSVLELLGSDLKLTSIWSNRSGSAWGVSIKSGTVSQTVGSVNFDASHRLVSAKRSWEMEDPSTKSPLDAIDEAVKSLEGGQFASCPVYQATSDTGSGGPNSR